jgi:integrase
LKEIEKLRQRINNQSEQGTALMNINGLWSHYLEHELPSKSEHTQRNDTCNANNWILPKWGDCRLDDLKAVQVEQWLKGLMLTEGKPMANGTKSKLRELLHALYRHGLRWDFVDSNPIALVRQSSKRKKRLPILTISEVAALLVRLGPRERTLVLLAVMIGLRRGEIAGLRWEDADFLAKTLQIKRSVVDMVSGDAKTEASELELPLHDYVAEALRDWQSRAQYRQPEDFIFATGSKRAGKKRGKQPVWLAKIMSYWIQPAARAAGITKDVGWHTFRRTYISLLASKEKNVKLVQELSRHSTLGQTLLVYAQAMEDEKRQANARVVEMIGSQNDGSGNMSA